MRIKRIARRHRVNDFLDCAGKMRIQLEFLLFEPNNVRDDPVAASKLNIKTDVKCDLDPSHCYVVFIAL